VLAARGACNERGIYGRDVADSNVHDEWKRDSSSDVTPSWKRDAWQESSDADVDAASARARKRRRWLVLGAIISANIGATVLARRRGYEVGLHTIVRCRKGHLFSTIWIPGASLKSLRLGPARLQRCPVGSHWSLVVPVKRATLSEEELVAATSLHDVRVP
jgi:hypothetical protein